MFKRIQIELTGPICTCKEQSLAWGVLQDHGLQIHCKTCNTKLQITSDKFVACFKLDTPHPGKEKPAPEIKVIDGGLAKVINIAPLGDPTAVEV